jgi:hypothetical protein
MVETIWIELPAPHAGIEPVSETRVRNGIFCCRDRRAKWANSPRLPEALRQFGKHVFEIAELLRVVHILYLCPLDVNEAIETQTIGLISFFESVC